MHNSGDSRRGNAESYLNVIARSGSDEAIQLPYLRKESWIASLALAMTLLGCLKFESVVTRHSFVVPA
jgi:hypothetical protein